MQKVGFGNGLLKLVEQVDSLEGRVRWKLGMKVVGPLAESHVAA